MATVFLPSVGQAYNFTLDSRFEAVNGIYKVDRILTYDEYLADDGNILEDFYEACSLTNEDVEKDLSKLRASEIIKISPPDDVTKIRISHIPMCFVEYTPDHNIGKYEKVGLIIYAGLTDSIDRLDYLRQNVAEMFKSSLGIDAKPHWVSINSQWMTESAFQEEIKKQEVHAKQVINYFSENKALRKQVAATNAKLIAYEDIIKNLQKQIDDLTNKKPGEEGDS